MLESYRSGQPSHSLGVMLFTEVLRYYAVLRLPAPPDGEGLAVVALPYFRRPPDQAGSHWVSYSTVSRCNP